MTHHILCVPSIRNEKEMRDKKYGLLEICFNLRKGRLDLLFLCYFQIKRL